MKTNKMMRIASILLVAVLLSICVISGTFAKYTTSVSSDDSARVAYWGFQRTNSINIEDLFDAAYDLGTGETVKFEDGDDVIAPGTTSSATFAFAYDETNAQAPEVAYTFTVSVEGSECAQSIQDNANIQWKLDNGAWGTWEQLLDSIKLLSGEADGSVDYMPGQLPDAFTTADNVHTVSWQWLIGDSDAANDADTAMGNAGTLAEVELVITITATQID